MSLKSCVVCVAGDLKPDIYAPATWEDADIERYCKQRGMTLVWEDMNKSVTHLVISRAAFQSKHAAVKYVQKDRRSNKKAKIVTYDWLEDSFAAEKAIQDVSAYHPGKPRDLDAIKVACSKRPKTARCKPADEVFGSDDECPSEALGIKQQIQTKPKTPMSSTLKLGSKQKMEAAGVEASSSRVAAESSTFKKQPTSASGSQIHIQKDFVIEKPRIRNTPVTVSDISLSWEAKHKPRVFCDKTDQFKYSITLTHKERPGEKWVLLLLKAPNVLDKAFLFRAYQYDAKGKIELRETNSPHSSFQKAFELFKISFRSKMGYHWEERLSIADNCQLGKWRYKLPAKGEPTGQILPEFDQAHPKYVKPKELAPAVQDNQGRRCDERIVSERPNIRAAIIVPM
ncbi:hypothetical protein N0V93_005068 [Gnomoniopsis smithogilvyi]|uniref:BRCT domain-containing protein n=1 Tax=Gnomoniopsis smithogilvyi TaxID=1191159 RepID=A0A9W8YS72_9PEZI|nr:hypothetical protein N0V93_005068 [Gnomoniopsis smithogilvyi]